MNVNNNKFIEIQAKLYAKIIEVSFFSQERHQTFLVRTCIVSRICRLNVLGFEKLFLLSHNFEQ